MGRDGAPPPEFRLDVATDGAGWTTVAVGGEVDLASAGELSAAVSGALAAGPVVVDLSDVEFMDSAGVRALNATLREAATVGSELRVRVGTQPNVVQVLELTGMMGLLPKAEPR